MLALGALLPFDALRAFAPRPWSPTQVQMVATAVVSPIVQKVTRTKTALEPWYFESFRTELLLTAEQECALSRRWRAAKWLFEHRDDLLKQLGRAPSVEEWAAKADVDVTALQSGVLDATQAHDQMVSANMRLVIAVCRPYASAASSAMTFEDLVQEGSLGLQKAVHRFDPERGLRFSTFATWWIRSHVQRAVSSQARAIRLPHAKFRLLSKAKQAHVALVAEHGRQPTEAELAQEVQVGLPQLRALLPHWYGASSIENSGAPITPLSAQLTPTEAVELQLMGDTLRQRLDASLSPLEADVLRLRYGLEDGDCLSWQQIAIRVDLPVKHARQAQTRALRELRKAADLQQLRPLVCHDGDTEF